MLIFNTFMLLLYSTAIYNTHIIKINKTYCLTNSKNLKLISCPEDSEITSLYVECSNLSYSLAYKIEICGTTTSCTFPYYSMKISNLDCDSNLTLSWDCFAVSNLMNISLSNNDLNRESKSSFTSKFYGKFQ